MRFERSDWYFAKLNTELEMETGLVDRHRSGYRSGRDSSTGRSSRLKHRSYSPFLQLKDIQAPTEIYVYIYFNTNKTFYKKTILTNHTFSNHLLNGFKL